MTVLGDTARASIMEQKNNYISDRMRHRFQGNGTTRNWPYGAVDP
jgi:hypothetical protein